MTFKTATAIALITAGLIAAPLASASADDGRHLAFGLGAAVGAVAAGVLGIITAPLNALAGPAPAPAYYAPPPYAYGPPGYYGPGYAPHVNVAVGYGGWGEHRAAYRPDFRNAHHGWGDHAGSDHSHWHN
jgi:hypothetical protein